MNKRKRTRWTYRVVIERPDGSTHQVIRYATSAEEAMAQVDNERAGTNLGKAISARKLRSR